MKKTKLTAIALAIVATFLFSSCEQDGSAPVITLNGSQYQTHYKGNVYVDPGATAIDDKDGDVSSKITVSGTVGTVPGNYTRTYTVTDMAGNMASKDRYVTVKYGNTTIAGTYSIVETAPSISGTETYTGTVTASTSDNITFTFSSTSGSNPISATASISTALTGVNGSIQSTVTATQGGPITNFSGTITTDTTTNITRLNLSYVRPFNGTTTNCTAVWTKQ